MTAACPGSDDDGPPPIKQALFIDSNFNGVIDVGDVINVTFRKDVDFQNGTLAALVFRLRGGAGADLDNATVIVGGLTPADVVIPILGSTFLTPNGKYTKAGPSTGIEVRGGQILLEWADSGKAVRSGRAVDVEGELKPHVTSVAFDDVDLSGGPTIGDRIVVNLTTEVDLLTAIPDEAFQVLPPVLGAFGAVPVFTGATQNTTQVTILLGASPALDPVGIFDPLDPLLGPSGLDISPLPGSIADTAFPEVFGEPALPPGFDIPE